MALPTSRDFDAVDAGPLPASTVNALQDGIVDHEARVTDNTAGVHGDRVLNMSACLGAVVGTSGTDGHFLVDGAFVADTGTDELVMPIPLIVGDQILSVRFRGIFANASSKSISLRSTNIFTGAVTVHQTLAFTDSGGATISFNIADLLLTSDIIPFFLFDLVAATDGIIAAQLTFNHP